MQLSSTVVCSDSDEAHRTGVVLLPRQAVSWALAYLCGAVGPASIPSARDASSVVEDRSGRPRPSFGHAASVHAQDAEIY